MSTSEPVQRVCAADSSTNSWIAVRRPGLLVRVCRECVRLLPVDGVAITVVADAGRRELVYATDLVSTALAALGEGPGIEACAGGDPVLVPDLGADLAPAWPAFAVEAATHSVEALFTFPVLIAAIPVVTLDTHRGTPGPLSAGDLVTVRQLAGIAALALSGLAANAGHWLDGDGATMSGAAMRYRQVSQATGMVMAVLDLSPAAAGPGSGPTRSPAADHCLRSSPTS